MIFPCDMFSADMRPKGYLKAAAPPGNMPALNERGAGIFQQLP